MGERGKGDEERERERPREMGNEKFVIVQEQSRGERIDWVIICYKTNFATELNTVNRTPDSISSNAQQASL